MTEKNTALIASEILNAPDYRLSSKKCRSWPYEEARKLLNRHQNNNEKKQIVFATGYGPSGLPHIGTFAEVARTTMVRRAFCVLSPDVETRLLCFSDDMDALRKIPQNIPNNKMLQENLGKPLSTIKDPFEKYSSFAEYNNATLCRFLDQFGFQYEFISSTHMYKSGKFDHILKKILEKHQQVKQIIIPTLRQERRKNYSPFLPICEKTGKVLLAEVIETKPYNNTIIYKHPDDQKLYETSILSGKCKLQWKPDWAMRWLALGVDYEMAGKDLIDSVKLSSKISRLLGYNPPEGFHFELFLDEKGKKISKSIGNGISVEQWLRYAPKQSLEYFLYKQPRKSKKLYFDVIPKNVDEYLQFLQKFHSDSLLEKLDNPIFHIHGGKEPQGNIKLTFALLLNLVSTSNAQNKDILWGFITKYDDNIKIGKNHLFDSLVDYAIRYFNDFVKPFKTYRNPNQEEKIALQQLAEKLKKINAKKSAKEIQQIIYQIGIDNNFTNLRDWFTCLYQVLLGQSQGPRFGSFVELYGIENTVKLIEKALQNELSTK